MSGEISGNDSIARFSVLSDDSAVPLEEYGDDTSIEKQSLTLETNLSNDDDMNDDMEENVFKSKGRRELRSVLKNKNPTPRLDNTAPSSKKEQPSFRRSPQSPSGPVRGCCTIV